jgi:hypothetical protein
MPSTVGIVASGVWTPLELSPFLWIDAADTTTITASSGSVSQWNDKSGNGRNFTQGTGGNQPTTGSTSLNGLNVISFDGTDDFMQTASFTKAQPTSVWFVGFVSGSLAASFFDSAAGAQHIIYRGGGNDRPGDIAMGAGVTRSVAQPAWPSIIGAIFNGGTSELYVNNSQVSSGNAGSQSVQNGARIGRLRGTTAAYLLDGYIAEMIVLDGVISTANRNTLHGYLSSKWGL